MANLYQDIYKAVLAEINMKENLLDSQRQESAIAVEAREVAKEVMNPILESIERNWKGQFYNGELMRRRNT